jgi:hypothetical protein
MSFPSILRFPKTKIPEISSAEKYILKIVVRIDKKLLFIKLTRKHNEFQQNKKKLFRQFP